VSRTTRDDIMLDQQRDVVLFFFGFDVVCNMRLDWTPRPLPRNTGMAMEVYTALNSQALASSR
jgi:hypothetical protein